MSMTPSVAAAKAVRARRRRIKAMGLSAFLVLFFVLTNLSCWMIADSIAPSFPTASKLSVICSAWALIGALLLVALRRKLPSAFASKRAGTK